jgi:tetratricopeptide (TPR) repeat protein
MHVAALLLLLGLDPETACAPIESGESPDPAAADLYVAIGAAEFGLGDLRTAVAAYRKALTLDPERAEARHALVQICARARIDARKAGTTAEAPVTAGPSDGTDPFLDGVRGTKVPKAPPDSPDALLAKGMSHYRAGRWREAESLLSRAAADRGTASVANLYLGLIAFGEGDGGRAARLFGAVGNAPPHGAIVSELRRRAWRTRRLSLLVLAQPEYDSNVKLLPETPPPKTVGEPAAGDFSLLSVGSIAVRPTRGLLFSHALLWRRQMTISEYSLVVQNLRAGVQWGRVRHRGGLRYDFDAQWLGGARSLLAHEATVEQRYVPADSWSLGARYGLRRRDFSTDPLGPFTGFVQSGALEVSRPFGLGSSVTAGLLGQRELTERPDLSNTAAGAQLGLSWHRAGTLRCSMFMRTLASLFDAADALGRQRRDLRAEGTLDCELDIADPLSVIAGLSSLANASSIEDFRYRKFVVRLGLAGYLGAL